MKWDEWRRSQNVEDYTDSSKPVVNKFDSPESINEHLQLTSSELAKDAGSDDLSEFNKAVKNMNRITEESKNG